MLKQIRNSGFFVLILLIAASFIFEAQTFYGKRQTGFYKTKEDGASFGYFVPPQFSEKNRYPLVIIFGKKATDVMTWKDLATKEGFIVVAIQPKLGGEWNYSWDMDRALKKLKELKNWYPIDDKKIYVVGYEKGGSFALIMAINQPGSITACAVTDAKSEGSLITVSDRGAEKDYLNVYAYSSDKARQRPLWMLNFEQSEYVKPEDLKLTEAILAKYGYTVTYKTDKGTSYAPTQKMAGEIYEWFKQQTK